MSGGRYDYKQFAIKEIIEYLKEELEHHGREIPKEEQWYNEAFLQEYPDARFYPALRDDVQEIMRVGIYTLTKAYIYAQRLDWCLSGDDDEDDLVRRINEELLKLEQGTYEI